MRPETCDTEHLAHFLSVSASVCFPVCLSPSLFLPLAKSQAISQSHNLTTCEIFSLSIVIISCNTFIGILLGALRDSVRARQRTCECANIQMCEFVSYNYLKIDAELQHDVVHVVHSRYRSISGRRRVTKSFQTQTEKGPGNIS